MSHAPPPPWLLLRPHNDVYHTDESCFMENLLPPDGCGLALVREIYTLCGRLEGLGKQQDERYILTHTQTNTYYTPCGSVQGAHQINRQIEPLSIKRGQRKRLVGGMVVTGNEEKIIKTSRQPTERLILLHIIYNTNNNNIIISFRHLSLYLFLSPSLFLTLWGYAAMEKHEDGGGKQTSPEGAILFPKLVISHTYTHMSI